MKCLAVVAGAALTLAAQISPAFALPTAPSITLPGLEPTRLGAVSAWEF